MKNKVFSLLIFGIVALAVFASFASATMTSTSQLTFKHANDIEPLTITNLDNSNAVTVNLPSTSIGDHSKTTATLIFYGSQADANASVNAITSVSVPKVGAGDPVTVYAKATPDNNNFMLGGNAIVADSANPSNSASFSVSFGNGNLGISIEDTSVKNGFGSDTQWYPLDEVNVKVNVQNNADTSSMKSVVIKWMLYDTTSGQKINSGSESSFSLSHGNEKTVTIDFILNNNLNKFNDGDNYIFYAWATGNDQEFNGDKTSVSESQNIDMQIENDFVILNNIQFAQSTTACGGQAEITADVTNIGSSDQNNVYVKVFSNDLNINQKVVIGDINAFEKGTLDFTFTVPSNAQEKDYPIQLIVYDENNNVYENSNNDLSSFPTTLTVSGACTFNPQLTITAAPTSGGKAGQELDVTATVTNTGTTTRTFSVDATDYTNWASLISTSPISPTLLTLNAGQTKQILMKLNVNSGVSGDQTFNLQLTENGKVIPQPITVTIQSSGFSLFTGNFLGSNGYLWAIGALNVLLVVIIIIVAVRVSRRNK